MTYAQTTRVVFRTRTKFWEEDGVTINLIYNHLSLRTTWRVAEEVDSDVFTQTVCFKVQFKRN